MPPVSFYTPWKDPSIILCMKGGLNSPNCLCFLQVLMKGGGVFRILSNIYDGA